MIAFDLLTTKEKRPTDCGRALKFESVCLRIRSRVGAEVDVGTDDDSEESVAGYCSAVGSFAAVVGVADFVDH